MTLSDIINNKANILSRLDPDRIYVENIRGFYNLPFKVARFLCDMAVKQHYFSKHIGIVCPNTDCQRLVTTVKNYSEINSTFECEHCRELERDTFEFIPSMKDTVEFYKLNKETDD